MSGWVSFFDNDNAIYVNARHRDAHAQLVGGGMLAYIEAGESVLDYGCGEAIYAERLAKTAGRLVLCEAAPHLRERLAQRVAALPNIAVAAPEALVGMPDESFDTIIMISVAQYLTHDEIDGLLALFRRLLKPKGQLIIGDVVQPGVCAANDAIALLRFGAAKGFFIGAVIGLARLVFSPYRKLRGSMGLTRYREPEMIARMNVAGFVTKRAAQNIGHINERMTFVATPRQQPRLA